MFFNGRVFIRLFISFLLILVLPILLIGGFSYYKTVNIVDHQLQEKNMLIVNNISKAYDNVFANIDRIIFFINEMPWISKIIKQNGRVDYYSLGVGEIKNLTSQILKYQMNVKQIEEIAVILNSSDMVFSSDGYSNIKDYFSNYSFDNKNFNGYEDIDWDEKNQVVLSQCLVSKYKAPAKNMMIIMKNIPLNDAGKGRACIMIQVNLEKIKEIFSSFTIGEKTVVQIADCANKFLLSSDDNYAHVIESMSSDLITRKNGNTFIGSEEYAYYFTSSAYNGFKYLVFADRESVNSKTEEIKQFTVIIAMISLLFGLLLSYVAARRNYRPIKSIIDKIFPNENMHRGERVDEMSLIEAAINNLSVQNEVMKKSMDEYIPVLKNNLIFRMINGTETEADMESHLKTCNISLNKPFFTVISMEISAMARQFNDENDEQDILSTLLLRYIEEYFQKAGDICLAMSAEPFTYVTILNTSCDSFNEMKRKQLELVEKIKEMLNNRYEIVAVSGIGRMHSSLNKVATAYKEARAALDCKFITADSEAICFDEIKGSKEISIFSFTGKESQLLNLLETGDYRKVEEYLDSLFKYEVESRSINSNNGMYMLYSMISIALRVLENTGENCADFVDFKKVNSFRNIFDTEKYIKDLFYRVCTIISEKKGKPNGFVMNKIINYLDSYYHLPNLSLTMLSEEFGLSNAYLSLLIKESLGKNFLSYVTQKRMERAEELLKDPDFPLKNIPSAVGFENQTNFRRVFKKHTAITPSEYRDNWLRCTE